MRVTVNGQVEETEPGTTVRDIVARHTGRSITEAGAPEDGRPLAMAVAVNGVVLRRADWSGRLLAGADAVDLVTAVQGG